MTKTKVMVIHLNKKMKISLAFAGGIVTGFWKFWNDHSTILMASKTAAIIEGCGTALLFGACGVIGKKIGDVIWYFSKPYVKSILKFLKNPLRRNEANSIGKDVDRTDGNVE